jgi:hypothetical protein
MIDGLEAKLRAIERRQQEADQQMPASYRVKRSYVKLCKEASETKHPRIWDQPAMFRLVLRCWGAAGAEVQADKRIRANVTTANAGRPKRTSSFSSFITPW